MSATAHVGHHSVARRYAQVFAIAPVAALGLMTMASPSDDGPTICPVALLTGVACPGCGMTRAMAWLMRGDFDRSMAYHPLAPIVLVLGLLAVGWTLGRRLWGWKAPSPALTSGALIGLAILLMGVWVARLLTGNLPPV
jgi:hypothetical protein